eukprot:403361623
MIAYKQQAGQPSRMPKVNTFLNKFLWMDQFGTPVSLYFEGDSTHKSKLGFFITLIYGTFLVFYFVQRLNQAFMRENPIITNTSVFIDPNHNPSSNGYTFTTDDLDFAIKLSFACNDVPVGINALESASVTLAISESWGENYLFSYEKNLTLCERNGTQFTTSPTYQRNKTQYLCSIRNTSMSIRGSNVAPDTLLIHFKVRPCNWATSTRKYNITCERYENYQAESKMLDRICIEFYYTQKFFNGSSYDQPVEKILKKKVLFYNSLVKEIQIFSIQKIILSLDDSPFYSGYKTETYEYFNLKKLDSYTRPISNPSYSWESEVSFQIYMDDELIKISRTMSSTVSTAFTDIGGLNSTLVFVIALIFSRFIELSYYRNIAQKIYKYNPAEFEEKLDKNPNQIEADAEVENLKDESSLQKQQNTKQLSLRVQDMDELENNKVDPPDESQQQSSSQYQLLKSYLVTLKSVGVTWMQQIFQLILYPFAICRLKRRQSQTHKMLILAAKKKLQENSDIANLVSKFQSLSFISDVLLKDYQLRLVPYTSENLLVKDAEKEQNKKENKDLTLKSISYQEEEQRLLLESFLKVWENQQKSKFDSKLLENLNSSSSSFFQISQNSSGIEGQSQNKFRPDSSFLRKRGNETEKVQMKPQNA